MTRQYTAVAIVLHWAIAAALLGNLWLGWWMHDAIDEAATQARAITAYQLHKAIGLTVLVLTVLRLLWRWWHPVPVFPAGMARWERVFARTTHWLFYGLILVLPLSGWLYVSTQWRHDTPLNVPTLWFGLFEVPHLFDLNEAAPAERRSLAGVTIEAHEWLAWSMAALFALHVLAALKHHFFDRDDVLASMLPGLRAHHPIEPGPAERGRRAILLAGFAALVLAIAAILATLFRAPAAAGAFAGSVQIESARGGWVVDPSASEIAFTGEHAGFPFHGVFTRWQADVRIHPANPGRSTVSAAVDTASATDGVPLHDETLPLAEWFDVANHPQATFQATRIALRDGGAYTLEGVLTLKGRALPVAPLDLTLGPEELRIQGRFEVDRVEADLGMESDPGAEYVSRRIGVEVKVRATPPQ